MPYELRGKTVLITGATGLLGKNTAIGVMKAGGRVRAFVRNPVRAGRLAELGAEIVSGDMGDPDSIRAAVQGCQAVFHFAGLLTEFLPYREFHQINVEGTRLLAEAALDAGVERFLHVSTIAVYGMSTTGLIDESSPRIKSEQNYSDSKLEGERIILDLVTNRGLPAVVVQPAQVYGPGDESWTLGPIEKIRSGSMILVDGGKGLLQPIYLDDVIEGILLAMRLGKEGQVYLLCGDQVVTTAEFFGHLARITGKGKIPSVPHWTARAIASTFETWGRMLHREPIFTRTMIQFVTQQVRFSNAKARSELGFAPKIGLEQGMEKLEIWLRQSGRLA